MSILNSELICYGSASRPLDDVSTSGGAIDATMRPVFTQMTANAIIEVVSDGADTRVVTVRGRDAAGVIQTTTITLNGTTAVDGVVTYERLLSVTVPTTSGTRTITVKQGAGGSTIATIPVNEKGFYAFFDSSASSGTIQTRYEKLFWKNTNGTLTLTSSQLTLTADPQSVMNVGVALAIDDSVSVANRVTAPASVVFVGVSTAQNVPNSGNLPSGSAVGGWIKQVLAANNVALRSTFTTQLSGTTT